MSYNLILKLKFEKELLNIIEQKIAAFFEIEGLMTNSLIHLDKKYFKIVQTQSIPMLYALWEGFIQAAFEVYIDIINQHGTSLNQYQDSIVIFHIESILPQLKNNQYPQYKHNKKIKIYNTITNAYSENKIFNKVETKSNVKFEVLNNLLETFCLEKLSEYWKKYTVFQENREIVQSSKDYLDELVNTRNSIAHGNYAQDRDYASDFSIYKDVVLDLINEIYRKMLESLDTRSFLKSQS